MFLVPVALFLAPGALTAGNFAGFVVDFAFYAVFSAIISTALARIMFASSGIMLAGTAPGAHPHGHGCPGAESTRAPQGASGQPGRVPGRELHLRRGRDARSQPCVFYSRAGTDRGPGGPSGGGKTTAASLIPRFWDVSSGADACGRRGCAGHGPHALMDQIAFVFQNSRLFKTSILENVRAARPEATREQVLAALMAAQCGDILEKLPKGMDTVIGTEAPTSPAESSSAAPSPVRWPRIPMSCSATNPLGRWTTKPERLFWPCCTTCAKRAGRRWWWSPTTGRWRRRRTCSFG